MALYCSYHESALYDVPAVIDYILEETGNEKLHFVSHSVGSKTFMSALTLRPEYNDKVAVGIMMGPAGFMTHMFNGYAKLLGPFLRQGQVALIIKRVSFRCECVNALPPFSSC